MDFINLIISKELVYALGWTVIHSLWQSIAMALLLAVVLLILKNHTAPLRYRLAYTALLAVLGLAIWNFFRLYDFEQAPEITLLTIQAADVNAAAMDQISTMPPLLQRFTSYFQMHIPLIVSIWLLGVAFFTLRLLGGLAYVQHLKSAHVFPMEEKWQRMLQNLTQQVSIKRPVQLMESALVKVPMIIGHLKPIILMPVGVVNVLSPDQVEAILAHELAHIARYDYLLNILQSVIEVLFYFNPGVWWIASRIRTEREHCCDDLAVSLCGDSLNYAKALVAIQEMNQEAPHFAMAFSTNRNQLLFRIKRILNQSQNTPDIMEKFITTCLLVAMLLAISVGAAHPYERNDPAQRAFSLLETMDFPTLRQEKETQPAQRSYFMESDTFPKGKWEYRGTYKGQQIETTIREGELSYLKIDGKEIPAAEFKNYENLVEEVIENIPPPPPPPPAPMAPPAPPAPPAPAPPPPPRMNGNENVRYEYEEQLHQQLEKMHVEGNKLQRELELRHRELEERHEAMREEIALRSFESIEMQENEILQRTAEMKMHLEQQRQELDKRAQELDKVEAEIRRESEKLAVTQKKKDETMRAWEQAMLKDGLIESAAKYSFKITSDKLLINGKKMNDSVLKKYQKIYEQIEGKKIKSGETYSISKNGGLE